MLKGVTFIFLFLTFVVYSIFVYTRWTEGNGVLMNPEAIRGKLLFQKHNCTSCHQLYGLGGFLGPELTKVISQPGKGEMYARAFFRPGLKGMPDFQLNKTEVNDMIAFLKYVDETANSYKIK